jgi:hypothetical protein
MQRMGIRRGAWSVVAALAAAGLLGVACGPEGGDAPVPRAGASTASTAEEPEDGNGQPGALPPCAEDRHGVVTDMDGTLTTSVAELAAWLEDPTYDPAVRPGAVELLRAWRARGYEIVYLTGRPADMTVGESPIADATSAWLDRHGFPTGEGTHLFVWDTGAVPKMEHFKLKTLVDLDHEGLTIDYGYTDLGLDVIAYRTAGLPAERIFTIGEAVGERGTVPVAEPGWRAHRERDVDPLPPVCEP